MLAPLLLLITGCRAFPSSTFVEAHARSSGFDSTAQYIDVTGAHRYVAPGPTDFRGPCPGLNALANHNFIPHNGTVALQNSIDASMQVFGMSPVVATAAGLLGALYAGNLADLSFPYSIGDTPPTTILGGLLGALGLFGPPQGLSHTHNQFESDSSATRGDAFQFNGNGYDLQMPAFVELYNRQNESSTANYDRDVIFAHRVQRLHDSKQQNGRFFYGPVQAVFSSLTNLLVYGLMSNHSTEYPDGILSNDLLKSLYGITGPNGAFVYERGTEQIPGGWYRRPIDNPYSATGVLTDLAALTLYSPETAVFGGNTGEPNTFAPLDISGFTQGTYTAASLLEGNNLACFLFQATQLLLPLGLVGLEGIALGLLDQLIAALGDILAGITCPELAGVDSSMLEQYPGYQDSSHPV
ncbi:oxidase-like protein [Mycena metata]|uniref:Oxidase-like protein n=1 Tax=Mycena metata TaxID=1033252 RepID=A0AAD7IAX7_9AGAR|nr:oxidase-like protein [Mycena metata]